jgi:bis(5'-adenosyl)-triphosphatase
VLVIPFRPAKRLTDLTHDEVTDLFTTVQKVQTMLAKHYFDGGKVEDGSFNISIQDGKWAGQTVEHLHCHVIPRLKGSTEGDGIYERLQSEEGNVGGGLWDRRPVQEGRFPRIEDEERRARSVEEMNEEAGVFGREMGRLDGGE